MPVQDILEARSKTVADMRALTDKATGENRDLTDDESRQFDQLKSGLVRVDGQLERAQVIVEAERSMAVAPDQIRRGHDGSFEEACRAFSITRAIAAQLTNGQVDAGKETEISTELARRSGRSPQGILVPHEVFQEKRAAVTTTGQGAHLYPETHRDDLFIDRLRAALRTEQLGATILSGLIGDQDIPKLTGSATAFWVAEDSAVTEGDHTFATVALNPKTVGARVQYTRRMLINASPAVEQLVRNDLARVLAEAIDDKAINGDGNSNTPTGILNTSGIGDVSMSSGPTWATVLAMIANIEGADALMGDLGFLTAPDAVKKMRATLKESGDASAGYVQETHLELAGYRLLTSSLVPGIAGTSPATPATLIFGNWADLLIGYWSGVDILPNPYDSTAYPKGNVLILALQDVGVAVRHPESFVAATDMDVG